MSTIFRYLQRLFPLHWNEQRVFRLPASNPERPYYIKWFSDSSRLGEGWDVEQRDSNGVLLIGQNYKPADIAQYALFEYDAVLNGSQLAVQRFLAQANYLTGAQREDGAYPYPTSNPEYGVAKGWISAMAQGEAASVLLRAWLLTKEERFRKAAARALEPLVHDVAEGGASYIRGRDVFFEEVASASPCHILNGHLFAAFGLWEALQLGIVNAGITKIHELAVSTLLKWLPLYDDGWSYYDLAINAYGTRHLAPLFYHQFHIAQLEIYSAMTGRPEFAQIAQKWRNAVQEIGMRARVWGYGLRVLSSALLRRAGLAKRSQWRPMEFSDT